MKSLTAFLVLNWSFWALVSLLIVQTLAKFLHKHTSPCRFPLAFPLTDSDTIKSVRVGGKNQGRSGNRKQRYFFIWPNRERASTYECPLPSLCFAVQCINKDGRYVLWFADIFSSPLQLLNGFRKNISGSKYSSQCPLPFVFSGQSVNKEGKWYSTYLHNIKLFGLCFTTLIQSIL